MVTAVYAIFHAPDEPPAVEAITVEQLWTDCRFAAGDEQDMLSAVQTLDRRGVARDTEAPIILVLGSAPAFREQLAQWYRATALSPATREAVQAVLGWHHPLGDAVDDAPLRALWTYLVEAGGEPVVAGLSPDDFSQWVAYGGYPRHIIALTPTDPTPENPDATVVPDELTGREFVLSA